MRAQGRQIHLIPNRIFMDNTVTIYPDGPPIEVVDRYFRELEQANAMRAARGLSPLAPLQFQFPAMDT